MAKKSNLTISDFEIDDDGIRFTVVECVQFRPGHKWRAWFNFSEVLEYLFVRIMMGFDASDEITEEAGLLLKRLTRDDELAVRVCAENFADRILGVECCDMAETIEKYDAVFAALEPWLKLNRTTHAIN